MHPHRAAAHADRLRRVMEHAEAKDKVQDRQALVRAVTKGVHEHEGAMHPGKKPTKLKLARGGRARGGAADGDDGCEVEGRASGGRLDRAAGGRGKKGHGQTTNVIVAPGAGGGGGGPGRPIPVPVPVRAPAAAGGPPPGAGMPPGGMPPRPMPPGGGVPGMSPGPMPGGAPMPPGAMGMRKRGGRTRTHA